MINFNGSIGPQDIDLCGPSVPKMLNVEDSEVSQCEEGWLPVTVGETLSVMSIGFLMTNKNEAVVWRGPKKNAMIKQFLTGEKNESYLRFFVPTSKLPSRCRMGRFGCAYHRHAAGDL